MTNSTTTASAVDQLAQQLDRLHAQHTQLSQVLLATLEDYIHTAAEAQRAGHLGFPQLLEAYDRARACGLPGWFERWKRHVPHDRPALRRRAAATPGPDNTWAGPTGWDGIDDSLLPPPGVHVAYVLIANGGAPAHIGFTHHFRARVKRLHHAGMTWTSWTAWPCADREQARALRADIAATYDLPQHSGAAPA